MAEPKKYKTIHPFPEVAEPGEEVTPQKLGLDQAEFDHYVKIGTFVPLNEDEDEEETQPNNTGPETGEL